MSVSLARAYYAQPTKIGALIISESGAVIDLISWEGLTYDDVMTFADAAEADRQDMVKGSHYNYKTQTWVDGHDHAHIVSNVDSAPLLFCGSDVVTCTGVQL